MSLEPNDAPPADVNEQHDRNLSAFWDAVVPLAEQHSIGMSVMVLTSLVPHADGRGVHVAMTGRSVGFGGMPVSDFDEFRKQIEESFAAALDGQREKLVVTEAIRSINHADIDEVVRRILGGETPKVQA